MTTKDITNLKDGYSNVTPNLFFDVSAGYVPSITSKRAYGVNEDVDPGTFPEIVRDGGGILTDYPYLSANAEMYLVSDLIGSTALVTVSGLVADIDNNWVVKTVTVNATGTTPLGIGLFIRILSITLDEILLTAEQCNIFVSTVAVGAPTQTEIQAKLSTIVGETQMAMYTIPSGYTGFLHRVYCSAGRSQDCSFTWKTRNENKPFVPVGTAGVFEASFSAPLEYETIKEKSDIVAVVSTLTNNSQARASFHFLLVETAYTNLV